MDYSAMVDETINAYDVEKERREVFNTKFLCDNGISFESCDELINSLKLLKHKLQNEKI